ncbi:hypothetical protein EVAR_98899_1 [Eumeta japonica]|uniref:Uncharacterized protein n=1 Tax=Eumeta variegata TaxID=151549 RepID=A0A4C1Y2E9_EUMVA|nr:hypothetical protein EVAR_98899_1 [Eumeta japonica]
MYNILAISEESLHTQRGALPASLVFAPCQVKVETGSAPALGPGPDPHSSPEKRSERSNLEVLVAVSSFLYATFAALRDTKLVGPVATRWAPNNLTDELKDRRVDWCRFLLEKCDGGEKQNVCDVHTVTIRGCTITTPKQSDNRSAIPIKCRRARNIQKQMVATRKSRKHHGDVITQYNAVLSLRERGLSRRREKQESDTSDPSLQNSVAVKLVTKASRCRKIGTKGGRRKGRGASSLRIANHTQTIQNGRVSCGVLYRSYLWDRDDIQRV